MSVTILLIPAALAAASLAGGTGLSAALSARRDAREGSRPALGDGDRTEEIGAAVSVRTRMKDRGLLAEALADIGAVDVVVGDTEVSARVDGLAVAMTLTDDDVWEAHFSREGDSDADASADADDATTADATAADTTAAEDVITRLDAAYARRVQSAVAERIRARADSAGFELVSETRDEDATVTMVLNVRQGG